MRHLIVTTLIAGVTLAGSSATAQAPGPAARVLLEAELWGGDHATLVATLKALRDAGETAAFVFADRVAGATAFPVAQDAQARSARVRSLAAGPPRLQPPFQALGRQAQSAAAPLTVEPAQLVDGDGYHVVLGRAAAQFLPSRLTIEAVRARLGPAERVEQQTIQNRGERKPVILTLHIYANGAVAYAESNMADPGLVDRVVLNLAIVVPVVAQ